MLCTTWNGTTKMIREVKRSEVEATQDTSSDNILSMSRDSSEVIITSSSFSRREFPCRRYRRNIRVSFDGLQGREARTNQREHLGK